MTYAETKEPIYPAIKKAAFFGAPLIALLMLLLGAPEGMTEAGWKVLAVTQWMALWWIFEVVPLAATALLPLVLFPLLGVLDFKKTAVPYASDIIFLFLGGFIIAHAFEKWHLHTRIALCIVRRIGLKPERMIGGFIAAACFLSLWISNTATILMLLPLVLAVVELVLKDKKTGRLKQTPEAKNFATALLLGVCYAVSIGGVGTLIGTPPNMFFKGYFEKQYGISIDFFGWMLVGVPMVVLMGTACWLVLVKLLFPVRALNVKQSAAMIEKTYKNLGRMNRGETYVALVALLTAAGWVFGLPLANMVPGLSDAGVAMIGAVAMFLIPVNLKKGQFLLKWDDVAKLPLGVLLLFGGGLSLSEGIRASGLDLWITQQVGGLSGLSVFALIAIVVAVVIVMSEVMSNIATIAILLPVLAPSAVGFGENPLLLAIPATLAASVGYMLPVATAANAIVFGTGYVTVRQMVKAGFILDIVGFLVILLVTYALALWVFDITPGQVPFWAQPVAKTAML